MESGFFVAKRKLGGEPKMKKRYLTLSVLIHAVIIASLIFLSSILMIGNKSESIDALMVSVSGNPDLEIGSGKGMKKELPSTQRSRTIAELGLKNATSVENSSEYSGQGGGTGLNAETSYTGYILQKIQEYKYYPLSAKKNKLTGVVKIRFTLLSNGSIKDDINIIASSGEDILDSTAIKIIKSAAPFPAFPQSIKEKELSLNVNIDFSI
jgi:TonB family protein